MYNIAALYTQKALNGLPVFFFSSSIDSKANPDIDKIDAACEQLKLAFNYIVTIFKTMISTYSIGQNVPELSESFLTGVDLFSLLLCRLNSTFPLSTSISRAAKPSSSTR